MKILTSKQQFELLKLLQTIEMIGDECNRLWAESGEYSEEKHRKCMRAMDIMLEAKVKAADIIYGKRGMYFINECQRKLNEMRMHRPDLDVISDFRKL